MTVVLVVNSGSSSLKYQLIEMSDERVLASGLIERIGEASGVVTHKRGDERAERELEIGDHDAAFDIMMQNFAEHGPSMDDAKPVVVGHRIVQGGRRFYGPTIIDEKVEMDIEELIPLAPLHNGPNLAGVRAARRVFANIPHVAVFDTAFHTTLSDAASYYALNREVADKYRVRKYGAHGTSHKYVSEAAAEFLDRPYDELRTVVLHIGNGASACAVDGGKSIDTSMGMTPLEGLVMGTRTGDIDPAVLFHLHRKAGYSVDDLDRLLNKQSGLLGLTGTNDVRDVTARAAAGDEAAELGLEIYVHRLRHYIGSYLVALQGADVIAWCGGVGENSVEVRKRALAGMEWLGVELDAERNEARRDGIREISTDSSRVRILVVPTNEEIEIARQSLEATGVPAAQ
ncbi:acetate/propionate family kinase [Gulosibacter molinativorax]|uniref:Acetate kinase n=1 Tax=Gulosibacter molinativorax TaxID=256821 RepID=A0ABT7CBD0_9MICO|nr:acetate kinase [Gulosibacter molinativorax]MDJ1372460.1 acetate kinase [Gulosibacter molinativorax]QUY63514.1 Acetate kinase [Gulosibacter molinativorax]